MNRDLAFVALSTYSRIAAQILAYLVAARVLGVEQFGILAYWTALAVIAALPVGFGFGVQMLRELSREHAVPIDILARTVSAKITLTTASILVALIITVLVPDQVGLFWLFFLAALVDSFSEYLSFALRAVRRFGTEAGVAVSTSVVHVTIMVSVTFAYSDVAWVAIAVLFSRLFSLSVLLTQVVRIFPIHQVIRRLSLRSVPNTLRSALPYAADTGLVTMHGAIDSILLNHLAGPAYVGLYNAGSRLMQLVNPLAMVLGSVYVPLLARHGAGRRGYHDLARQLGLRLLVSSGTVALVLIVLASDIVALVFGDGYTALGALIPWLALTLILRSAAAWLGINLTAQGHQQVRVYGNIVSLACLVVVALLVVPRHAAVGMLFSTSVSAFVLILVYAVSLIRARIPIGIDWTTAVAAASVFALGIGALLIQFGA
jgi:O-antigen/teichoic acid export membrane protein